MKKLCTEKQGQMILFLNVPVGATIRFNGCRCIKLDTHHVKFLTDSDGAPIDYSKACNQRYARTTQACIEGTPCWILELPQTPAAFKMLRPTPNPMKTKPALFDQVAEGTDLTCMVLMLLPLAFPAVAFIDGASEPYLQLSILALIGAMFAIIPLFWLLVSLITWFSTMESRRIERERENQYLLNGGRL